MHTIDSNSFKCKLCNKYILYKYMDTHSCGIIDVEKDTRIILERLNKIESLLKKLHNEIFKSRQY